MNADLRLTNGLLAGILVMLALQVLTHGDRPAEADTLRLDACITERLQEAPQQYLHVVSHPPTTSS